MRGEPLTTADVEALFGTSKVDEDIVEELRTRDQTFPRLLHAGLAVLECFVNIQIKGDPVTRTWPPARRAQSLCSLFSQFA